MPIIRENFDLERIQRELKISDEKVRECPVSISTLKKIYEDYIRCIDYLELYRIELLNVLNEKMTADVHSIRGRIKEPDHVIGKIIRGARKKPEKYKMIRPDNYWKILTDLVGIRIIILDKREWKEVHQNLLTLFNDRPELYCEDDTDILENYDRYSEEIDVTKKIPHCCYHAEMPTLLIPQNENRSMYESERLRLDFSKGNYRSVHYNIRYKTIYFEIQVRTIFEEGWLEFDHRTKYPKDQFNRKKKEYVRRLGQLAEEADDMISAYNEEDFTE